MNFEFMQQVAPQIALPPRGQWITPEQGNDQPLYGGTDSNGERMPLPYFQQGGERSYYSPTGATGLSTEGAPVRATARASLGPIEGIRGRQDPMFDIPGLRGRENDTPINSPTIAPITNAGPRVPPSTDLMRNGLAGITEMPNYSRSPLSGLPRLPEPSRLPGTPGAAPSRSREYTQIDGSLGNINGPPPAPNQNVEYSRQLMETGSGGTLFDMFEQAQFPIPEWLRRIAGRTSTAPTNEQPVQDLRGRTGQTQRTSQWNRSPNFNLSTPEGLAEFNDRMGLELGDQIRTREEQRRLYERGLTPTLNSYHITGEAFDVPSGAIGGLTGENAVNAVLTRMRQARYNVDDYVVKWETGHGTNQGTGPHVHVEPRNRSRRRAT